MDKRKKKYTLPFPITKHDHGDLMRENPIQMIQYPQYLYHVKMQVLQVLLCVFFLHVYHVVAQSNHKRPFIINTICLKGVIVAKSKKEQITPTV